MRSSALLLFLLLNGCGAARPCPSAPAAPPPVARDGAPTPITLGQTFRLASAVLGEERVINVSLPPGYSQSDKRLPVLYALDGGMQEDFPHVAGVIDVWGGSGNRKKRRCCAGLREETPGAWQAFGVACDVPNRSRVTESSDR